MNLAAVHAPRRARWLISLGLIAPAALARPLLAQTPSAVQSPKVASIGADGIAEAELARHLKVLLADSMRGRDTPSGELERTAQYLVRQFLSLGLQPGSKWQGKDDVWSQLESVQGRQDSGWLQRYPIPGQRRLDLTRSRVLFYQEVLRSGGNLVLTETGGQLTTFIEAAFDRSAYFVPEFRPPAVVAPLIVGAFSAVAMGSEQVALVAGRQTPAALAAADLRAKVAIYVPPVGVDIASQRRVLEQLYRTTRGVVLIGGPDAANATDDMTSFAAARHEAEQQPMPVAEAFMRDPLAADHWPWVVAVWPPVIRGLATAGVDVAQVRTDTTPRVQDLPYLRTFLRLNADTTQPSTLQTAPNVMGWIEGSDSVLRQEILVISTRMDGSGKSPRRGDHPGAEGAGDNTAGVAALLALAEAWSRPETRPRRSVLLLAVSGGAKELWGSRFFLERRRPVGLIANLTIEMNGGPMDDSVTTLVVEGAEDIERLALSPDWVAAAQPELGVRVITAQPATRRRADHVPFMQWGVPSLYLYMPSTDRGIEGPVSDDVMAVHAARVARLVFAVGQAIANADARPGWKQGVQARRLIPEP